jgi:dATP pyrophosphohydrolase
VVRAPFNVLVYPYFQVGEGAFEYGLLRRADEGWWQGVTGGGEDNESFLEAARRETFEETGIPADAAFLRLDTIIYVRVTHFGASYLWGDDLYVIPQYCFGVRAPDRRLVLSHEHTAYRWLSYDVAYDLARWDGNKTALWELDRRLRGLGPRDKGQARVRPR